MFVYRPFHYNHAYLTFAICIKSDWKHSVPYYMKKNPGNQTTGGRYIYALNTLLNHYVYGILIVLSDVC
jgi:hypothetical protein